MPTNAPPTRRCSPGYLGTSTAFEDAMAAFAARYADRNERDHAALLAAVRAGRLEARTDA